ncbi:mRNA-degrading endonuclease RelE of RelBE toxin-antitoxin system [Barrientosiimonas humi]|uniref:mRNA-degrading endonuclease RelE of RelBE toxin-antitoxin system n=1 Tax=Barrientosiimonas humi TaxID=999931 RepID=A0A542XBE6_9MICO|nr:type II toxin-antitoxin system RelE/ParE family toxin [Barrientosiimonas humi]TQL33104.1 mRNA-degrading endonuclease RelE of RelBE toxin-antitoxin system [Barrientosiimonas humi]CAG7573093.1 Toxin RelE [Barrientosiimonas humi]
MSFTALLSAAAIRDLDQVPPRVTPAIIEFIYGPLVGNPHRVGKPLRDDFEGQWSARRGDYRILYVIDDQAQEVVVSRIGHRARVYKSR